MHSSHLYQYLIGIEWWNSCTILRLQGMSPLAQPLFERNWSLAWIRYCIRDGWNSCPLILPMMSLYALSFVDDTRQSMMSSLYALCSVVMTSLCSLRVSDYASERAEDEFTHTRYVMITSLCALCIICWRHCMFVDHAWRARRGRVYVYASLHHDVTMRYMMTSQFAFSLRVVDHAGRARWGRVYAHASLHQ